MADYLQEKLEEGEIEVEDIQDTQEKEDMVQVKQILKRHEQKRQILK